MTVKRLTFAIGSIALWFAGPAAPAADVGSPGDLLKSRGLVPSKSYFLLPAEAKVFDEVRKLAPYSAEAQAARAEYFGAKQNQEQFHAAVEAQKRWKAEINKINGQLKTIPNNRQNQAFRADLLNQRAALQVQFQDANAVAGSLRGKQLPPRRIDFLYDQYKDKNSIYYANSGDMRRAYVKVVTAYNALKEDQSVKAALTAYGREKKFAAQLGPSKELRDAIKSVRAFEKEYPPADPKAHDIDWGDGPGRRGGGPPKGEAPAVENEPIPTSGAAPGLETAKENTIANGPVPGPTATSDVGTAKEKLKLARSEMMTLNFKGNPERAPVKRRVIDGLERALKDLDSGKVAPEALDSVRQDVDDLQAMRPMRPANLDKLRQASLYLAGAVEALAGK